MTVIVGMIGLGLLAGLFTMLRPSERGCSGGGNCVGCTRDGACEAKNADATSANARRENVRSVE